MPADDLGKTDVSTGPTKAMIWGDTIIESGPGETLGTWTYSVNTSNLLPTAYFVRVYSDGVRYSYIEHATALTARLPTQTEPAQIPGFGIIGCIAGCARAFLLLFRR